MSERAAGVPTDAHDLAAMLTLGQDTHGSCVVCVHTRPFHIIDTRQDSFLEKFIRTTIWGWLRVAE